MGLGVDKEGRENYTLFLSRAGIVIMSNGYEKLGILLKRQRFMAGLTLRQLSLACGVSASQLSRIEKGKQIPSIESLQKIARPLGFEVAELLLFAGYLPGSSLSKQ
jgi:transcriptional regulator with XRE-family HTH domain